MNSSICNFPSDGFRWTWLASMSCASELLLLKLELKQKLCVTSLSPPQSLKTRRKRKPDYAYIYYVEQKTMYWAPHRWIQAIIWVLDPSHHTSEASTCRTVKCMLRLLKSTSSSSSSMLYTKVYSVELLCMNNIHCHISKQFIWPPCVMQPDHFTHIKINIFRHTWSLEKEKELRDRLVFLVSCILLAYHHFPPRNGENQKIIIMIVLLFYFLDS